MPVVHERLAELVAAAEHQHLVERQDGRGGEQQRPIEPAASRDSSWPARNGVADDRPPGALRDCRVRTRARPFDRGEHIAPEPCRSNSDHGQTEPQQSGVSAVSPHVASEAAEHLDVASAAGSCVVLAPPTWPIVAAGVNRVSVPVGCEPPAQVDLLVVHEVRRVEPTDGIEVSAAYRQGGTQHPRHRAGRLEIEEWPSLLAELRRSDELPQTGLVQEHTAGRRELGTRGLDLTLPHRRVVDRRSRCRDARRARR